MNLISSSVALEKYIWGPVVVILGTAFVLFYKFKFGTGSIDLFDIIFYTIVPIGVFEFIYRYWSLMDKVWDSGNSLIFIKKNKEIEIPYSQVKTFKVIGKEYAEDSKKEFFVKVDLVMEMKWGKSFKFKPATEGDMERKPIEKIYEIEANINNSKN